MKVQQRYFLKKRKRGISHWLTRTKGNTKKCLSDRRERKRGRAQKGVSEGMRGHGNDKHV